MKVLIVALADHASISQPGDKLNVNGVFDTILAPAPNFPIVLPSAALAVRIQLEYEDRQARHQLEIVIANQDGKEFTKFQRGVEAKDIPPGGRAVLNQIIFLQQLTFKAADEFSVIVRWNGDEKQRIPLDVAIQAPPPASA